jgi:YgiT-type zinc finger domain-containing protein
MKETKVSRTVPLAGGNVKVENVKASVCEECGEAYLDGPTILKIEARLLKQALVKT